MDKALEHGTTASTGDHAKLLFTAGSLLIAAGRNQEVAARLDESIRLARAAGDQQTLSWALTQRGFATVSTGRPDLASPMLDQACTASREHGAIRTRVRWRSSGRPTHRSRSGRRMRHTSC